MDKSFKGIYSYFLWQQLIINVVAGGQERLNDIQIGHC